MNRRDLLTGAAGAVALSGLPVAAVATESHDPVLRLLAERKAAEDAFNASGSMTEEESDAFNDHRIGLDKAIMETPASTLEGAAAVLAFALEEVMEFHGGGNDDDFGGQLLASLVRNALGAVESAR